MRVTGVVVRVGVSSKGMRMIDLVCLILFVIGLSYKKILTLVSRWQNLQTFVSEIDRRMEIGKDSPKTKIFGITILQMACSTTLQV